MNLEENYLRRHVGMHRATYALVIVPGLILLVMAGPCKPRQKETLLVNALLHRWEACLNRDWAQVAQSDNQWFGC
jgi:hypothetical protein